MSVTNYAEGVRTERRDQVLEVTLDRPKANARSSRNIATIRPCASRS
jgi:enoyl-CoA hydratase/carnithine racemase